MQKTRSEAFSIRPHAALRTKHEDRVPLASCVETWGTQENGQPWGSECWQPQQCLTSGRGDGAAPAVLAPLPLVMFFN
jgi:hypothetical protein